MLQNSDGVGIYNPVCWKLVSKYYARYPPAISPDLMIKLLGFFLDSSRKISKLVCCKEFSALPTPSVLAISFSHNLTL